MKVHKHIIPATIILMSIIADQLAKQLLLGSALHFGLNSGVAFGVFSQASVLFLVMLTSAALFLLCLLFFTDLSFRISEQISWSLMIGGGLSNLMDRLRHGGVIDYLYLGFGPRFNLADCWIVAGIGIYTFSIMRRKRIGFQASAGRQKND